MTKFCRHLHYQIMLCIQEDLPDVKYMSGKNKQPILSRDHTTSSLRVPCIQEATHQVWAKFEKV